MFCGKCQVVTSCALTLLAFPVHSQTIRGIVLDDSTSAAIAGAEIFLIDSLGDRIAIEITDRDGRFLMTLGPGRYSFQALRMGFAPTVTAELDVVENSPPINLTITLPTERVVLEPVVVSGERQPFAPGPLEGFYQRKRRGWGIQLSLEEIEAKAPGQVTDIFRGLAGVRVVGKGGNNYEVYMVGQAPSLSYLVRSINISGREGEEDEDRGACPVSYYVDGMKYRLGERGINEFLVSEVEAVEVYRRASETPAEFLDSNSRCGVVVIWTKRGDL